MRSNPSDVGSHDTKHGRHGTLPAKCHCLKHNGDMAYIPHLRASLPWGSMFPSTGYNATVHGVRPHRH